MESIEDGKTSPLALNYKLLWFLLLSKQNICHTMEKVHQAFTKCSLDFMKIKALCSFLETFC